MLRPNTTRDGFSVDEGLRAMNGRLCCRWRGRAWLRESSAGSLPGGPVRPPASGRSRGVGG